MKLDIGGYFELELSKGNGEYHNEALKLNSATNCLEYILRSRKYSKVYVPYYTCEVVINPIIKCGIEYEFYALDINLNPSIIYELKESEAFLYTNYFGLKDAEVKLLKNIYGNKLIVDNAQSFYSMPEEGVDTFYSARKFFGVPDGAYLYSDNKLYNSLEDDVSYDRMLHLLKRIDIGANSGYSDFRENEKLLLSAPLKKMSKLTATILGSISYKNCADARIHNFEYYNFALGSYNELHINYEKGAVPMVYPFLCSDISLRDKLLKNKIYCATYWPNVREWCKAGSIEYDKLVNIIPLPVDQRYGLKEINYILDIVRKWIRKY